MKITPTPPATPRAAALPRDRPPVRPSREAAGKGGEGIDWESLVPFFIHPVKVAIVEALDWIGQPLSSTELASGFEHEKYNLGVVAYHIGTLARLGVIEAAGERQARGAREVYYYFPTGARRWA